MGAPDFPDVEEAVLFLVHAIDWLEVPDREGQTALQAFFDGQLGDPIETARGRAEILTERPEDGPEPLTGGSALGVRLRGNERQYSR